MELRLPTGRERNCGFRWVPGFEETIAQLRHRRKGAVDCQAISGFDALVVLERDP